MKTAKSTRRKFFQGGSSFIFPKNLVLRSEADGQCDRMPKLQEPKITAFREMLPSVRHLDPNCIVKTAKSIRRKVFQGGSSLISPQNVVLRNEEDGQCDRMPKLQEP